MADEEQRLGGQAVSAGLLGEAITRSAEKAALNRGQLDLNKALDEGQRAIDMLDDFIRSTIPNDTRDVFDDFVADRNRFLVQQDNLKKAPAVTNIDDIKFRDAVRSEIDSLGGELVLKRKRLDKKLGFPISDEQIDQVSKAIVDKEVLQDFQDHFGRQNIEGVALDDIKRKFNIPKLMSRGLTAAGIVNLLLNPSEAEAANMLDPVGSEVPGGGRDEDIRRAIEEPTGLQPQENLTLDQLRRLSNMAGRK